MDEIRSAAPLGEHEAEREEIETRACEEYWM